MVDQVAATGRRLIVVTKGDLFHQEAKVAGSGLADRFERVEIVSEKDVPTYRRVIDAAGVEPDRFFMIGNSVRSDVLPVVELGGHAAHLPYAYTWEFEHVPDADAAYDQAIRAGAQSIHLPADQPYGDRNGGVTDRWGNQWYMGTPL